jgi:hypothetical protein
MDSFTLGPTLKIDFTQTTSTHRQRLESIKNSKDLEISNLMEDKKFDRSIAFRLIAVGLVLVRSIAFRKIDFSSTDELRSIKFYFDRSNFILIDLNFDRSHLKSIDLIALANSSTRRNNLELWK